MPGAHNDAGRRTSGGIFGFYAGNPLYAVRKLSVRRAAGLALANRCFIIAAGNVVCQDERLVMGNAACKKAAGANKSDVRKYLERQQKEQASRGNSALADQLAKWKAQQEEDE